MNSTTKVRKIAFLGDHLPRKCGIATFTSDLLAAVASAHPQNQCLAVSVNDIPGGYEYPEVVRFEVEEQDLSSYMRSADFLNISNVDVGCLQHEFGIFGGSWRSCDTLSSAPCMLAEDGSTVSAIGAGLRVWPSRTELTRK